MTLFRQIALMLSIFLVIILTTVLVLNFQSANQSVQERMYSDAKNTASSLSLSLGSANGDVSMMSTMINANFDSGNYKYISLIDVEDEVLYERTKESTIVDVPQWFLDSIKIEAPIASANVSAGWLQVGVLNVQSDVGYAYVELYTILKNLLISFSIITVLALIVLNILLAVILKPLKKVQLQAEAVTRNEFIIQKEIPYTKEFKDVVLGMNNMVSKVQVMFEKGNEELKRQKELEYIDKATKLKNRKYLIDKLPQYLKIDASSKSGINIMVALSGVIEANKKIGHKSVDDLFVEIANIFTKSVESVDACIVARMNGTEFALFLPSISSKEALEIAQDISKMVEQKIQSLNLDTKETFISLGLYEYNYKESISKVLSASDNALAKAKFSDENIYLEKSENALEIMGKEAWKEILLSAINENRFAFVSWNTVDARDKMVVHKALSLTLKVDEDTTYYYGQFMASANELDLSHSIYDNVLSMMFKTPSDNLKDSVCSLRLPYEYLMLSSTYSYMEQLFKKYANLLPFKLIIEMPDKLVQKNSKDIKQYKALLQKYNIELGIFEFIGESGEYHYLQDLRPIYIKAEANYFITQTQQALSALRLITDSVDISLIASGVMDIDTLDKLEEKDIYIVQGKVTELI